MHGIEWQKNAHTLLSFDANDDAGVYQVSDDVAIVQTVDFITPVVDDPYIFGQIAAANSLSDIFAMGARVHTVMNLVMYDSCNVTQDMLNAILRGGLDKIQEAGGVVLGGHTIEDIEMKYGLSVTGLVHPDAYVRNNTTQPGDRLILTKPLGMGVITTALKAGKAPQSAIDKAIFHMTSLNKTASEVAVQLGVHAMTDVTGFGLLGHLYEMTHEGVSIEIEHKAIPIIEEAHALAELGTFPGGSKRNMKYYSQFVAFADPSLSEGEKLLLYDAQTSGGLLIAVAQDKADTLLESLRGAGIEWCAEIGKVYENKIREIFIT
jgi:selenide,water dikinase